MNAFVLFAGVDVLLLVINVMLIRKNERILKEIRRCNYELAGTQLGSPGPLP